MGMTGCRVLGSRECASSPSWEWGNDVEARGNNPGWEGSATVTAEEESKRLG